MISFIKINNADNVAVALADLPKGKNITIDGQTLILQENIPVGHKFAVKNLVEGENVIKYGSPVGHTIEYIPRGGWVNEHNIKTNLEGILEYTYRPAPTVDARSNEIPSFMGFRRANGSAGIRNEIWIVPTVGCVNGIAQRLVAQLHDETKCEGIDAVTAFTHNYGCSQLGDDHENTRKILHNIALHPNAGAVLVIGLGCENNQLSEFRQMIEQSDPSALSPMRMAFMETQKVEDEIEEGMRLLRILYRQAIKAQRTAIPVSELKIGLKCGGSDGLSGITANPLLGLFSDWLIECGGTSVLTEVPEMFGAETILMNRACSREVFDKIVRLINGFKEYFLHNNQPVYENPSPGNKAGGISTLEEKSLGCTQKSGNSAVRDVLAYGERLSVNGLNLLSAPGNDLVASTALAAAGCHLIIFTTGRGTPFGTFVPTMKVSTNSLLACRKPQWIDFNAGTLAEGEASADVLRRFTDYILQIASGEYVNNELNGYREIAIFKTGVTL